MNKERSQWKYTTVGGLQEFPELQEPDEQNYTNRDGSFDRRYFNMVVDDYNKHIAGLRNIPPELCQGFTSEDEGKEFSENEVEIVYQLKGFKGAESRWDDVSEQFYSHCKIEESRRLVARKKVEVVDKEQDEDRQIELLAAFIVKNSTMYYPEAEELSEKILSNYIIKRR